MKTRFLRKPFLKVLPLVICGLLCLAGCVGSEGDGESDYGDGDGSGDGSDDGFGDGSDGGSVSSSSTEDIADASVVTVQAILGILSGGGNPSLSLPEGASMVVPNGKTLTVTSTSSCSPSTGGTTPTASIGTINGADISSGGSGSCVIKAQGGNWGEVEGTAILADCDSFSAGSTMNNIYFDGQLRVGILEASEIGDSVSVRTQVATPGDFLVGGDFDGNGSMRVVNLVIYWIEQTDITVNSGEDSATITYSDGVEGCLSVNGEAFSVMGYKSGSYSLTF